MRSHLHNIENLLLLIVFIFHSHANEGSPTLGEKRFFLAYFQGKRILACNECHSHNKKVYLPFAPGPELYDSWYRKTFKASPGFSVQDAILDCMKKFQQFEDPKAVLDLSAFLQSISNSDHVKPYPYPDTPLVLPRQISSEKPQTGRFHEKKFCAWCHERYRITLKENLLGRESIYRKVRGMLPLIRKETWEKAFLKKTNPVVAPESLREDCKTPQPPLMPILGSDRLSEEELLDIIEFLVQRN